ncbi:hypothetical protein [Anabaena lutea]|nr:hypothetical protein [Anabaena lutea]
MSEKFSANCIRYYTNKVRAGGLTENQEFSTHPVGLTSGKELRVLAV